MKSSKISLLLFVFCLVQFSLFSQENHDTVYTLKWPGYKKTGLSKANKSILIDVARTMRSRPKDNFAITSYCVTENQRFNQANWDRANKVMDYLIKKQGIDPSRLLFKYGAGGGDCNTIEIAFTREMPGSIPAPHPNLRKTSQ